MKTIEAIAGIRRLVDVLPDGCYIAGGAARAYLLESYPSDDAKESTIKDVDLFFASPEHMATAIGILQTQMDATTIGQVGKVTRMRVDGLPDLELVAARYKPDLHELLRSFDLVGCMFGWSAPTGWMAEPQAIDDAVRRVIRYNTTTSIVHTMKRIDRYISRGWTTADDLWITVARACQAQATPFVDMADYDDGESAEPAENPNNCPF